MAAEEVNEFDILRQRIRERQLQREKEGQQAVTTQFSSRGTLGSGAEIRAQERQRAETARQAQEERRDVLIAEADVRRKEREAERQREFLRSEAEKQRGFLKGERLGSQKFTGEQNALQQAFIAKENQLGRALTTSEREATEAFVTAQSALDREFTTSERQASEAFILKNEDLKRTWMSAEAEADRLLKTALQKNQLDAEESRFVKDLAIKAAVLEQQKLEFESEFRVSVRNNIVNAMTALKTAGYNESQITSFLNNLGLDPALLESTLNDQQQPQTEEEAQASLNDTIAALLDEFNPYNLPKPVKGPTGIKAPSGG